LVIGGGNNFALRIYENMRMADSKECETFGMEKGLFEENDRINVK